MTSTTSNRPATPLPASRLPASQPAATAVVSVVDVLAAVAVDRVALVAGATGLVGRAVLARLLADKAWSSVHCVGRRAPDVQHPKLVVHVTPSFSDIDAPRIDDVFIALGTTIKTAGSREAFRAVDFDAVVAIAKTGKAAGASRVGVVSAMGADTRSTIFYSRIKGEMEAAVSALGFDGVVFARPSLLAGDRSGLNQRKRFGEKILTAAFRQLKPLIPANYRSVEPGQVANALVDAVREGGSGKQVILSGELGKNR